MPCTLEAKGPKGHSSLSVTLSHSHPLSDGLPLSICHSKMTTELHHTCFSCSTDTMLHHLYIVQYGTVVESCGGRFESIHETIAAVTGKNKPNIENIGKRLKWGKSAC